MLGFYFLKCKRPLMISTLPPFKATEYPADRSIKGEISQEFKKVCQIGIAFFSSVAVIAFFSSRYEEGLIASLGVFTGIALLRLDGYLKIELAGLQKNNQQLKAKIQDLRNDLEQRSEQFTKLLKKEEVEFKKSSTPPTTPKTYSLRTQNRKK